MKKFNHLHVPGRWRHYWSKYPEGYTILESLLNWVHQVDEMVDNVNGWNEYLDDFVETFDSKLKPHVIGFMKDLDSSGRLSEIINDEILQEKADKADLIELENHIATYGLNVAMPPINLIPDGVTDDTPKFQEAINILQSLGGGKLIIPQQENDYTMVADNPTIFNPKMVRITGDNIHIEGVGSPKIVMKGITKSYVDSVDDKSSSGRDFFTGFSFWLSENCSIKNLRFEGNYSGMGVFRYDSPRAKGVGFVGTRNCWAENITGERLLGNVINGTPSDGDHDGVYRGLEKLKVSNCFAFDCLENGFNFMGNTHDCVIERCTSYGNSSCGVEAGGTNLKIIDNDCRRNKLAGIASSGDGVIIRGNTSSDNDSQDGTILAVGIQMGGTGTNIILSGNRVENNEGFGLNLYPGHRDLLVTGNLFINNHYDTTREHANNLIGTSDKPIIGIEITGNVFTNTLSHISRQLSLGANINTKVYGNHIKGLGTPVYAMSNCEGVEVFNNIIHEAASISTSAVNSKAFNNPGVGGNSYYRVGRPYAGDYEAGDYVYNTNPSILGVEGSEHVIKGWFRVTTGNAHVNGVDWVDDKLYI